MSELNLSTDETRVSYGIGRQLGDQLRDNPPPGVSLDAILADSPDVVIIATGGLPHTEVLKQGNDLVVSTWDIISGDVKPGTDVLIYDDAGDHAGMRSDEPGSGRVSWRGAVGPVVCTRIAVPASSSVMLDR